MTEDEMVGWHHRLNEHECEQAPGDGERQGGLVCCSPWGHKESYKRLKAGGEGDYRGQNCWMASLTQYA